MINKPNILIIGHNVKHADIFNFFSNNIFILADFNYPNFKNHLASDIYRYCFIKSKVNYNSYFYMLRKTKEIRMQIKIHDIDIVMTNGKAEIVPVWLANIGNNVLKLSTFHNSYAWNNRIKSKLLVKFVSFFCDGNIALSSYVFDFFKQDRKMKERVLFLPNTLDYSLYSFKHDYSINKKNIKICYIASISTGKNQLRIIELLSKRFEEYYFSVDFIGEINDEGYKKKIEAINLDVNNVNVVFKGPLDNDIIKSNLYSYDIYISPSLCEMSPYNILEAKCAGLPIIANNVWGQNDLLIHEDDGFLIDFNNDKDFRKQLSILLSSKTLRENVGRKARLNMMTKQSCKRYSEIIYSFIMKLRK